MMVYAFSLCLYDVAVRAYVSFWSSKAVHDRTPFARHSEYLRFSEMTAFGALGAAFFMFFVFGKGIAEALIVLAFVLGLDTCVQYLCLHAEARRFCAMGRQRSYRDAMRRVHKRSKAPIFE
jgi:hypothetical protein